MINESAREDSEGWLRNMLLTWGMKKDTVLSDSRGSDADLNDDSGKNCSGEETGLKMFLLSVLGIPS